MITFADRFAAFVSPEPNSGCWLWLGVVTSKGYGQFRAGRTRKATHVALKLAGRPRPSADLIACHKRDVPSCVNPDHLYWGSPLQNQADRLSRTGHHYRDRTHCKRGHELTAANWIISKFGRQCRECQRANARERYAIKKFRRPSDDVPRVLSR